MGSIYFPTPATWDGGMAWTLARLFPARAGLTDEPVLEERPEDAWRLDAGAGMDTRHLLVSICSDRSSRLHHAIPELSGELMACGHSVRWVHEPEDLQGGDVCLFLGYRGDLDGALASLHTHNLVVRESGMDMEAQEWIAASLVAADPSASNGLRELRKLVLRRDEDMDDFQTWRAGAIFRLCKSFVNAYP